MRDFLSDLSDACMAVTFVWSLVLYARGYRLELRPPASSKQCATEIAADEESA